MPIRANSCAFVRICEDSSQLDFVPIRANLWGFEPAHLCANSCHFVWFRVNLWRFEPARLRANLCGFVQICEDSSQPNFVPICANLWGFEPVLWSCKDSRTAIAGLTAVGSRALVGFRGNLWCLAVLLSSHPWYSPAGSAVQRSREVMWAEAVEAVKLYAQLRSRVYVCGLTFDETMYPSVKEFALTWGFWRDDVSMIGWELFDKTMYVECHHQ